MSSTNFPFKSIAFHIETFSDYELFAKKCHWKIFLDFQIFQTIL